MTIGPISSAFNGFNTGGVSVSVGQQAAAVQADEVAGLLSATFGSASSSGSGLVGAPSPSGSADGNSDLTALLAAYSATKALAPVALAYMQSTQAASTMSTLL